MNVVDSSGWIEYFENGENADTFAPVIEATESLLVPATCLYEVFRHFCLVRDENAAVEAIAFMTQGAVADIEQPIAILAAKISAQHKLGMADSLILATVREHRATLWTQDQRLQDLAGLYHAGPSRAEAGAIEKQAQDKRGRK